MSKIGDILKHIFVTQTKGFIDVSQKKDFWSQFATENNGLFKVIHTVSYDLASFNLKIPLENGSIEFSESDAHPFKVVCEIDSDKQVEFSIIKKDFISNIFNIFTQQKRSLNPEFDKRYTVKCKKGDIFGYILKNESITPLILKTNIYSIICWSGNKEPKIAITGVGIVNSLNEMQDIYSLFQIIISRMEKL